jgi:hypothetical protein
MTSWRRVSAAALAAALALAAPARAQQSLLPDAPAEPAPAPAGEAPTSILPEGFEPPAPPAAAPVLPDAAEDPLAGYRPPLAATQQAATEMPVDPFAEAAAGREIAMLGPLGPDVSGPGAGYGPMAFAGADGWFLAGLMRRIEVPLASRWAHIVLRRALLTEATAPARIGAADWIAERAWLLVRMGEVDGAKLLVDAVPIDSFSARLYLVAGQVNLAAADIPGLCPLAPTGAALSRDPLWRLAVGMCAAFVGDDITAAGTFDRVRDDEKTVDMFDVRLAERTATIAGTGGRASNVDWAEASTITPFRFALAAATGLKLPADKVAAMPLPTRGWVLRAPGVAPELRAAALRPAGALGIASGQEMVNAISAAAANDDTETLEASPAGALRRAYAAPQLADRLAGLKSWWDSGDNALERYAAQVATGIAAARIAPDAALAADAPALIAARLAVGADGEAARWWPVAQGADAKTKNAAWGLLAAGAPTPIEVTPDQFRGWMRQGEKHRAALLLAGLDGLGRTGSGSWDGLRDDLGVVRVTNAWTQAIDAAAAAGRTGEVAVLAATALQGDWAAVPPAHFQRLIAALVKVGREHEARMIVAEAVMRA